MALLFIKQLLFPRSGYSPIPPHSPVKDREDDSNRNKAMSEKFSVPTNGDAVTRINPRVISDATIGLSDGLTVPFALTAGLSALGDTDVVVYGGIAELIAGGISMGLGGYLGANSEAEAYHAALSETKSIVAGDHDRASEMVKSSFEQYDFPEQTLNTMTTSLLADPELMVDFLMRFHYQLAEADHTASRVYASGLTISMGYFFGGLVPLVPYLFFASMDEAFVASIVVMGLALFAFGWAKTSLLGEISRWICFRNGVQMMMLGGVAAAAAMGCVKAVGS